MENLELNKGQWGNPENPPAPWRVLAGGSRRGCSVLRRSGHLEEVGETLDCPEKSWVWRRCSCYKPCQEEGFSLPPALESVLSVLRWPALARIRLSQDPGKQSLHSQPPEIERRGMKRIRMELREKGPGQEQKYIRPCILAIAIWTKQIASVFVTRDGYHHLWCGHLSLTCFQETSPCLVERGHWWGHMLLLEDG